MSKTRTITIIRHGETALNVDDRIRGWLDVPLDEEGFEEATELGEELKGSDIDCLIVSNLTRTLQTAVCVSRESGIPIVATTSAFRPWDVGEYTGKSAEIVHPLLMKMAMDDPDKDIKGGESFNSFRYRVLTGLVAFLNEYRGEHLGIVGHHRIDRIIRAWVEAGCPDDFTVDMKHFNNRGIKPGTSDVVKITSNLIH